MAESAESTCSTVCTRTEPSPIVVARSTVFRFSIVASIVGSSCKILASKLDAGIRRRGLNFQRDLFAGVQRRSADGGGLGESHLRLGDRRHGGLTNKDFVE